MEECKPQGGKSIISELLGAMLKQGLTIQKETKSERVQLLIRPSTKEALKQIAEEHDESFNNLVNEILEDYVNERKEIKQWKKTKSSES